eukprot:SAG11_NODE_2120_length_3790_cov_6.378759_4_plen_107_part_00
MLLLLLVVAVAVVVDDHCARAPYPCCCCLANKSGRSLAKPVGARRYMGEVGDVVRNSNAPTACKHTHISLAALATGRTNGSDQKSLPFRLSIYIAAGCGSDHRCVA